MVCGTLCRETGEQHPVHRAQKAGVKRNTDGLISIPIGYNSARDGQFILLGQEEYDEEQQ